ncbi:hypothetical protein D046_0783 [Vibrio parahaemolyticus V-223/04]|nr:hypothetical protein D046_0783 [Vibrio parahaemolyticus V-223/04]
MVIDFNDLLGCMGLVFCAGYPGDMYSYHFSIYVKTAT